MHFNCETYLILIIIIIIRVTDMQSMRCRIGKQLTMAFASQESQNNRKGDPLYIVILCIVCVVAISAILYICIKWGCISLSLSEILQIFQIKFNILLYIEKFNKTMNIVSLLQIPLLRASLITATTSWNYLQRTNLEKESFHF